MPLLPFYSRHFGATPVMIGALLASFALCQFIASPWLGRASDRYGRKPVLLASQIGTFLALALLATAQSLWIVFAARIIDGLTSGNISVAAAYAVDNSNSKNRRQAIGVVSAAIGTGIMIGPALSAVLARFSISAPIWGAAVFSGLSVIATLVLLPRQAPAAPVVRSVAAPSKVPLARIIADRETLAVLIVLAGFYLAMSMYVSQFALFLSARFAWHGVAFGPRQVGIVFTAAGAVNILVQLVAIRRLSAAFSEKALTILSLSLLVLGYLVLALTTDIAGLVLAVVLAAFGGAVARPTLTAALTLTAAPGHQGALMGVNTSLMALGNIVGPLLAGALIGLHWYVGWALSLAVTVGAALAAIQVLIAMKLWPNPTPG